jgi:hypothetical protein
MPKKIVATAAFVALFPATLASADSDTSAATHCRRYANTARLVTHALHRPLFATTLSTTWCYDGQHVVRLAGVRIVPTLSTLGSFLTWEFKGAVPGASENRVFSRDGRRRAGYRVRRIVQWQQCPARCFNYYLELNNFLYWDGHKGRLNRVRK